MKTNPVLITENSLHFRTGQLIEAEYKEVEEGIQIGEHFVPKSKYVMLTEKLSPEDEKIVRDLIIKQFKKFFWNLYTKSSVNLG
jgi:hypothetical protein